MVKQISGGFLDTNVADGATEALLFSSALFHNVSIYRLKTKI